MAASTRFPFFDTQFFAQNSDGVWAPAAGYVLDQYISGSTTNQDTYTDAAGLVPNAHPIVLDSEGRCTMYGTPTALYTLVLRATAAGTALRTWDDVAPNPTAAGTSYLPLAGGTMLGAITLPSNATASLHAVPLQQLNTSLAALTSSVNTAVASATAAAAAATAAAAAVTPQFYQLAHATGGATTLSVTLSVGTWQVVLDTNAKLTNPAASSVSVTVTQAATLDSCTVGTSIAVSKSAADTQTLHVRGLAVGTLVVSAAGTYTMDMAAVVVPSMTSTGSVMTIQKIA